jgi:hypothetical protein
MTELTPSQRQSMIAAGGCVHTPNPFVGCDTCERPPITVPTEGVIAYSFVAQTIDGTVITRSDSPSVEDLPLETVRQLVILTDSPRIPRVIVCCDPDKGERVFRFRRNIQKMSAIADDGPMKVKSRLQVEVIEIRDLGTGKATRLYLHPTLGPIFSSQDHYW